VLELAIHEKESLNRAITQNFQNRILICVMYELPVPSGFKIFLMTGSQQMIRCPEMVGAATELDVIRYRCMSCPLLSIVIWSKQEKGVPKIVKLNWILALSGIKDAFELP
jgi:hypothetical protein